MRRFFARIWTKLGSMGLLCFVPTPAYLKVAYFLWNGKKLNLNDPEGYSDKINWLKVNYRNPEYTRIVDKAEFKGYVLDKLGERGSKYLIRTLRIYDSVEDANFRELPTCFVIKCTHDSHSVHIVTDKMKINEITIKKDLRKHMRKNFYWYAREWPYKDVRPRVIVDELISDGSGENCLTDYKWFCFNGEPKVMYVGRDTGGNPQSTFFDMNYKQINMRGSDPIMAIVPQKPAHFEEMKEICRKLSAGMPHVRVDFYIDSNGNLYIGEMTFFHNAGFARFYPETKEEWMGDFIKIR